MKKPKMIIFDAGRTLIDYSNIDTLKGVRVLAKYITSNPRGLSVEEMDRETNRIFEMFERSRKQLLEVPEQTMLALVNDLLELKYSISIEEIERIIWTEDADKIPVKHARELLDELNKKDIKTAVISNLDFSGYLLKEKLDELFPNNRFEFVIASSDYGVRKPHSYIFEAGVRKSGLDSKDIWYVGDKIPVDVEGSRSVGMIPVLFKCPYNDYGEIPDDLIVIDDFLDLLNHIDG